MILTNNYIEIDDYLPPDQQEILKRELIHPSFPWGMSLNSVYGNDGIIRDDDPVGFFHTFMYQGQPKSEDFGLVAGLLEGLEAATYGRVKIKSLDRIRGGLFTKHPSNIPHAPHVDGEYPHWTAVYYVNDCDGDFILYNETYPEYDNLYRKDNSQFTIKHICKPKQGKLIVFDGKHFHSSSFPNIKPLRIAITFNFTVSQPA